VRSLHSLFHPAILERLPAALAVSVVLLGTGLKAESAPPYTARHTTLAITYAESGSTHIDMVGSVTRPGVLGEAEVSRKEGRTRVKLRMKELPHPQSLGSFYTTYLLWAVAPEGQAASLAELPYGKDFDTEVTTPFQTLALIVTAEPHGAVSRPSPLVIAENAARKDTVGGFQTGRLEYSEASYEAQGLSDMTRRDFVTPLLVLGAHRAVEIARQAGAAEYDRADLDKAEVNLGTLDRAWPRGHRLPRDLEGVARDVMRISETARVASLEREGKARLADERRAANAQVADAQSAADQSRDEAARARERARADREEADRAKSIAAQEQANSAEARAAADAAQSAADQARMREGYALDDAARARHQADEARADREQMQQQLYQSLSSVLETRQEARGLIVSLSDVLFDFDRASLTPGAREKLSKLAGILLAYPGSYHLATEGHTDSIGSHDYNLRLSRDRAESVQAYLMSAGIRPDHVGPVTAFAETRPVASNDTAAGRQMNRRVEIVISDLNGS
jgi:outer membrane protein OmpA-like peptidoglycan-associated protein